MTPEGDITARNNRLIMVLVAATSCLSRRARNAAVASLSASLSDDQTDCTQVVFALPSDCVNGALHQLALLHYLPRRSHLNGDDRALLVTLVGLRPKARRRGLRLLVTPDTFALARQRRPASRRRCSMIWPAAWVVSRVPSARRTSS